MKLKLLPISGNTVWQNNKPFIYFVLSLLIIYSVLKIIFYCYNYHLLFTGAEANIFWADKFNLIKWSLLVDISVILAINSILLFMLQVGRLLPPKLSAWLILPFFILLNSFAVLLNLADIFYFPFHVQRANADLLYVLDHPLKQLFHFNIFIILAFVVLVAGILFLIWQLHKRLYHSFINGRHGNFITGILLLCTGISLFLRNSTTKILVPNYPMVELKSNQLPVVQNSFHTFSYSVFRQGEGLQIKQYMTDALCDSIFPIRKKLNISNTQNGKKNIVLFIMESVPFDFFDTSGAYKVAMPFFDSLLEKSTFYNNAFCYAHESNKGITAILAGIPTISDIPVYHSQYINMPVTPIGTALKKLNYQSFFCIGDAYDNFGFAKCMNWLGIDKYYSKEAVPDYKTLPAHSMGLQDEFVLNFFHQKINEQQIPFFAIQYNISTHYPYDIPASFAAGLPKKYTDPMKSMLYYDYSLQQFFTAVKTEPWFSNTIFIFCSDHWMFPTGIKGTYNAFSGYRIPVIIYDPSINKKKIINEPVSQFDIPGTILAIAGYKDSIISYGGNLQDRSSRKNLAFSKPNSTIYQVTDSSYVLGFNITGNKAEYLYNYKKDSELKENLLKNEKFSTVLRALTIQVKAFIQKAGLQFNGKPVK